LSLSPIRDQSRVLTEQEPSIRTSQRSPSAESMLTCQAAWRLRLSDLGKSL
jgi:hypothetical protein